MRVFFGLPTSVFRVTALLLFVSVVSALNVLPEQEQLANEAWTAIGCDSPDARCGPKLFATEPCGSDMDSYCDSNGNLKRL